MSRERVLLVDDEELFVAALSKRMESRGLQVDTVSNGAEALEKAEHKEYDAVVLDLAMPGMDGIETLQRLLEINRDLQIVLLTGHATVAKGVEAMKLGALDLMEKPAVFSELLAKIEQAGEKKALILEKRTSDEVADILKKHGW